MASKPHRSRRTRGRGWTGYVLSFLLGAFLAVLGYAYFSNIDRERPYRQGPPSQRTSPFDKRTQGPRGAETAKEEEPSSPSSTEEGEEEPSVPGAGFRPRIAIVIDDLGQENHLSKELLLFDVPVTFSILPFTTYSRSLALKAPQEGKEVILHLPMEPHGYPKVNAGEGVLRQEMNEQELLRQLAEDIESVPNIKGVSNHMGSRMMEDPEKLRIIFSDLKKRGLFFLDSRTTPRTVGLRTAMQVGLRSMERTLFIDHSRGEKAVKAKLDRLIQVSLSKGIAIGIGHPHPTTVKSIREVIPKIKEKGIEVVPLSDLFHDLPDPERP